MKSLLPLLLLVSQLAAQTPAELDRIVRKLSPDLVDATVAILVGGGSGSGVIVSPEGLVITAAHVTMEPGKPMKVLLSDGRELPATSLGVDHGTDGALLQINGPGPFPHRPYVKTKTYKVDDWAIAVGHPGGPIVGRSAPVRLGRITEAGTKSGFADAITTTATVISGDSGGPLYNLKGEVIGINSNISSSWRVNKHVPLPCIVEKWDALLASESFGQSGQFREENDNPFDEPYQTLRDRFEEALPKYAGSDPEAAALQARPRLLSPHRMQELLDRWEPDAEATSKPQYGLSLNFSSPAATIAGVIKDSPAAKAGLKKGDVITSANGEAVSTSFALARTLSKGGTLTLVTSTGSSLTIEPAKVPQRKHFPQPIAGVIDMIVTDTPDTSPDSTRLSQRKFLTSLDEYVEHFSNSVLPLKDGDNRDIALATVIHESGQLLTKASAIEDIENLIAVFEGQDHPVEVMGVDEDTDLALVRIRVTGLVPVEWSVDEPVTGQLVISPLGKSLLAGIITQPGRAAPKRGFEPNYSADEPSAYIGVTFSAESTTPIIETIDLGSPADKIGLIEGDKIVAFEGKKVEDIDQMIKAVSNKSIGDKVSIKVKRGDEELTFKPILDERPAGSSDSFDRQASRRDTQLSSLSARGGKLSDRKTGFPYALYHDQFLKPRQAGSPLVNLEGKVVGINIARAMRHRSLAIPTLEVDEIVERLRKQAGRR